MDFELLHRALAARGEPPFRSKQVWGWLAKGARDWDAMTDLPVALREALAEEVPLSCLSVEHEAISTDGTRKALFHTADGRAVEAVLMPYRDRGASICVSSQSGCPLTCTFCATGSMRFGRNLSRHEIVDQALHFKRTLGTVSDGAGAGAGSAEITNCVFMGMGEPMMNLDGVLGACERLPQIGIGHRHITISTVGWIPGIEALAAQDLPVRLALSLHAADEALRSELMPVNDRYALTDVIEACERFYDRKHRRVFVEYVMLAGVNDRYEQASELADLLAAARGAAGQTIFKVNLIPYNPTRPSVGLGESTENAPRFTGSSREAIAAFKAVLLARGIPTTVRLTRGRDIDAACGQLAAKAAAGQRASVVV